MTTIPSNALLLFRSSNQLDSDEGLLVDQDGLHHEGAPDLIPEAAGFLVHSMIVKVGTRWVGEECGGNCLGGATIHFSFTASSYSGEIVLEEWGQGGGVWC